MRRDNTFLAHNNRMHPLRWLDVACRGLQSCLRRTAQNIGKRIARKVCATHQPIQPRRADTAERFNGWVDKNYFLGPRTTYQRILEVTGLEGMEYKGEHAAS